MAILFVASEAFELAPFARRLAGKRTLNWPLDYAEEADWNGKQAILVANGPGPQLAAQAVRVAIEHLDSEHSGSKVRAVFSIGLCGGLNPAFLDAQLIAASSVSDVTGREMYSAEPFQTNQFIKAGLVFSGDRVICTVEEKQSLRQLGGDVVEMEAAGVASQAKAFGVPFYCVKAVSDRADESLSFDMNEMRTSEGRFSRGRIIRYALTHPWVLPGLFRLKRRSEQASEALGDFLVGCRV